MKLYVIVMIGVMCAAVMPAQSPAAEPTVESGYVDVDGGRLYYEKAGTGDAIVLIHDGMVHCEGWDGQFLEFAKDHTVVRYDRRGYGRSAPPTAQFSNVDDLHAVFEALSVGRAVLIGGSAGGGLAIDYTLVHPDNVSALVLVGAVVSGLEYTPHFQTRGGRLTAEIFGDPDAFRNFFVNDDPYEIAPENTDARAIIKRLMDANPHNLSFDNFRMNRGPERPALGNLGEICVPALIIVGEADIADVHAHAGAIDAGIPVAQRMVMRGAGHLVAIEKPEELNQAVRAFLNEASFLVALETGGVAAAVAAFHEGRKKDPKWIPFDENEMNQRAYTLLFGGEVEDAIALFELNVEAYPDSWNVYDSLAEAYMTAGKTERAIELYRKSLDLNPDNANAVAKLQELGAN